MLTADDRQAIQNLAREYALYMDQERLEDWKNTWAEDGTWEGKVGTFRGRDEILNLLETLGDRARGKRHIITNSVILDSDPSGNAADHICYTLVFDAVEENRLIGSGVYSDRLVKEGGRWKFQHRKLEFDANFRPGPS